MNFFDVKKPNLGEEDTEKLFSSPNITINRIVSRHLGRSSWYNQDEDEWLLLVEGEAELEFESDIISLKRGDTLFIEAHKKHRILSTSEHALWLTVHMANAL